jgi:hypothetical protein
MDTETAWNAAILCVAIFNAFNYVKFAFRSNVFRCFGRVALSYSSLIYFTLMTVIPVSCTLHPTFDTGGCRIIGL